MTRVLVHHSRLKPVHVDPARLEGEVAEPVVERTVFEHEHDDVLDLVERVDRVVELDLDEARGRVGGSS